MTEEKAEYQSGREVVVLAPQDVREVNFYGDLLTVVLVEGMPYVAVRPITDFLGVEWTGQYQRIQRDDVLNEERRLVVTTGADGKRREMVALPLEMLPGWLFGISGTRLKKPEMAEKLRLYRRDCFRVLWREFGQRDAVPAPAGSAALLQVRDIGLALVHMAEEQMQLQTQVETVTVRVDEAHTRLDRAVEVVEGFGRRLTRVEHRMMPYESISAEQATEVRLAVQRLGELLTGKAARVRKGEKLPNYYSGIFMEIYNRTGAPRYELIRVEDYAAVMQFLESWYKSARPPEEEQGESGTLWS